MRVLTNKNKYQILEGILSLGFLLGAYFLSRQIPYSSGDDAYFSSMAQNVGLWDYLSMRYNYWTGRMATEILVWVAFRFGRFFWAVANAIFLLSLPLLLIRIVGKIKKDLSEKQHLYLSIAMLIGVLFLGMDVFGYGSFWITGSVFYLWCTVIGICALLPLIDLVFEEKKPNWKHFLYSIPCAAIAAMSQEQVASVVLVLGAILVAVSGLKRKKVSWWLALIQVLLMPVFFGFMLTAPGNAVRTASEISMWLPEFSTLPIGLHIFITFQWMLTGLANQSKMLFFILWLLFGLLLLTGRVIRDRILGIVAFVFAGISLLPYVNISSFSDMGMGEIDPAIMVEPVPVPSALNGWNWLAMGWWSLAMIFTLVLLWYCQEKLREKVTGVLLFLAGIASVALMYFTPTIYASGWRVFFLAQVLLWLLIGIFFAKQEEGKQKWLLPIFLVFGVMNFLSKLSYMLEFLGRGIT